MNYSIAVIGGGIVGLSTAWQLLKKQPGTKVILLEKESHLAMHQTGHNSGVIHSGVYYQPGSLKSEFCKQGLIDTIKFCNRHGIKCVKYGKLLVATSQKELERMSALYEQCRQNKIDCELLTDKQLHTLEPDINGLGAIHVKSTGIVNFRQICEKMADEFRAMGGVIKLDAEIHSIDENDAEVMLGTADGQVRTGYLVSCAGLQADRLARLHGLDIDFKIIPFRGEYFRLSERLSGVVRHLIYPVPDIDLPFLGIHLTRMIDGSIIVGPNAVLGWKREGYGSINFNIRDTAEMLGFMGFWKMMGTHFQDGIGEMKNAFYKAGYLRLVQKYCNKVTLKDMLPYPAGVRAQAVLAEGSLVHDFLFAESQRSIHVCNAPSPAATSAIPIGSYLCSKIRNMTG